VDRCSSAESKKNKIEQINAQTRQNRISCDATQRKEKMYANAKDVGAIMTGKSWPKSGRDETRWNKTKKVQQQRKAKAIERIIKQRDRRLQWWIKKRTDKESRLEARGGTH
jgi:predicted xylose isomerase-like sugar epimerase